MKTFYIYESYERGQALAICKSYPQAKQWAKELAKQFKTIITVRDALGGLRLEINPTAPEQHQTRETK